MRDVLGDALWAAMILWWVSALAPKARLTMRAVTAVSFCWAIELGQILHPPWLEAIRQSRLGHLVLGSDFDPRDFAAYAAGVVVAALLDWAFRRPSRSPEA